MRSTEHRRREIAYEQHSLPRTVALHLVPGALITVFYVLAAPVLRNAGFPSLMAIFLAIGVVLVPFELGYLVYVARRSGVGMGEVVRFREPAPRLQLAVLALGLFVWSAVIAVLVNPPLDRLLVDTIFSWIPAWFFLAEDFAAYSTSALLVTWLVGLFLNGLVGPIVEELYFRGHLLPRISRLGGWAPLLNGVLFSVYHFFTPWQNIGRIVALLPMVYAVWWKRNIYLGIMVHCLGNVSSMLLLLPAILR